MTYFFFIRYFLTSCYFLFIFFGQLTSQSCCFSKPIFSRISFDFEPKFLYFIGVTFRWISNVKMSIGPIIVWFMWTTHEVFDRCCVDRIFLSQKMKYKPKFSFYSGEWTKVRVRHVSAKKNNMKLCAFNVSINKSFLSTSFYSSEMKRKTQTKTENLWWNGRK